MSRTAKQIRDSLSNSIRTANPNMDLDKGSAFSITIAPVAPELAETEKTVEDLSVLASLQMASVISYDQIRALGTSFGLAEITGGLAYVHQTFWTTSRPTDDIAIERGTIVATQDSSLAYVVTERVVMYAANADAYLNAARRRYEITAKAAAVAIGESYNLPAYRITRLVTPISGLGGTENREPASGGSERQSFADYLARIRYKFFGLNPESGGGLRTLIFESAPDVVKSVMLVTPKDRKIFRRDTGRPAVDCYVLGTRDDSITEQFIGDGTRVAFTLAKPPVRAITSVVVNNAPVQNYALMPDVSPSTSGSGRAVDQIVFGVAPASGAVLDVTYTFDRTIRDLQDILDSSEGLYQTDALARWPVSVPVSIQLDCSVLPSFDANRVTDQVLTEVYSYIEPGTFTDSVSPERLVARIQQSISGVSSVRISRFTRTTLGALPVETINFEKNELSIIDAATLVVTTRQ